MTSEIDRIRHYLLVFDHAEEKLAELLEFGEDADAALAAYAAKEAHYGDQKRIETVLLGADSLDTIKVTHANYFGGNIGASKYLADI